MDSETVKYILDHFSHLLNGQEKLALAYAESLYKDRISKENNVTLTGIFRREGWISQDETVADLLKNGYGAFEIIAAKKILDRNPGKVFLNNCGKCGKLARTPLAKQCRHCGYNWH